MSMKKSKDRTTILNAIKDIKHPEINETLVNLGMILDVTVKGDEADVAVALPVLNISDLVRDLLIERIKKPIDSLDLCTNVQFFEMTPEVRDRYIVIAKNRWRGSKK